MAWPIQQKNNDCKESAHFQRGGPEKLTGTHDPQHALQKNGGLTDLWYMDDGDIVCHPILVQTYLQEFDLANAKVRAERNPQKTGVIYYVHDLGAASLEWRNCDVQNMARVSTVTAGSITPGVTVGPRQCIADPLGQSRRHAINARTRPALPGPADGICPPPRQGGSWPHQPRPASTRPHNPPGTASCRNLPRGWAARTALPRSRGGQYDASDTQLWPLRNRAQQSARHRGSCTLRISHSSQAVHPSNDPRRSLGRLSTRALPGTSPRRGHRNSHLHLSQRRRSSHGKVVCSESSSGSRRSSAANKWRTNPTIASFEHPRLRLLI